MIVVVCFGVPEFVNMFSIESLYCVISNIMSSSLKSFGLGWLFMSFPSACRLYQFIVACGCVINMFPVKFLCSPQNVMLFFRLSDNNLFDVMFPKISCHALRYIVLFAWLFVLFSS